MSKKALKIRPPRVFLGGPFSAALTADNIGALRFADLDLRNAIESSIEAIKSTGVELLNSHIADGWGEGDFGSNFAERDIHWVEESDVYVALLLEDKDGCPYRSDGTFIEIGCALSAGKDVVLVMDRPGNSAWSFFVRDLVKSPLVRVTSFEMLLKDTESIIFNGLLNSEVRNVRMHITDVCLWNWFQHRAKIPLPVKVGAADLVVYPGVMNPRFSHSPDFFASFWRIPKTSRVLDLGCGCGVNGINALLAGAGELLAVDLNPLAVENTIENIRRNHLETRGTAIISDVFSAVSGLFDVILFNPPYHDGDDSVEMLERASFDTPGHGFLRSVLKSLRQYLKPNGRCYIAYADQGDISLLSQLIQQNGLKIESLNVMRPNQFGHHVRVGWELRI